MTTELTNEQVAAFLRDHEDFFCERSDLLELLRIPDPRGPAVSLLERQATVLRARNGELRKRLHNLLDVAHENDQLFEKTRQLVLDLLEADSLDSLLEQLCSGIEREFGPDTISLLLYQPIKLSPRVKHRVRCLAHDDLPEALQIMLQKNRAICGVLRPAELEALFADHFDAIQSAAMVPLLRLQPLGLLAIGSNDPHHFKSSLDTVFISHIGEVMSRRLAEFLPTSAARERSA